MMAHCESMTLLRLEFIMDSFNKHQDMGFSHSDFIYKMRSTCVFFSGLPRLLMRSEGTSILQVFIIWRIRLRDRNLHQVACERAFGLKQGLGILFCTIFKVEGIL